ncbi:MAG TPA: hypothetical protein VKG65_08870 [Terriglobales bacterium]|nr:hypothetical protein [Terriglobales bacterium]
MSRYRKRLLWIAVAAIMACGFWVLNVEITYERNVRHIPTDFRVRRHNPTYLWKA